MMSTVMSRARTNRSISSGGRSRPFILECGFFGDFSGIDVLSNNRALMCHTFTTSSANTIVTNSESNCYLEVAQAPQGVFGACICFSYAYSQTWREKKPSHQVCEFGMNVTVRPKFGTSPLI